jgi:hypothetical protein
VGNFEQPAHGSPANADEWASVMGDDVSEPGSPLLGVRSAVIFFIFAANADAWACHNCFWNETCFPDLLEPIKQHLKIIKIRTIRIWTFSI